MLMSITEACTRIHEALDLVKQGQDVELTQDGEVVAVWVSPARLQKLSKTSNVTASELLQEELVALRKNLQPLPKGSLSPDQADALISTVRQGRDALT